MLAIGSPAGLANTVSRGVVADPARRIRGIEYIQTDASIDPGNSGGPLVAGDGAVGVNVFILAGVGAARFALPIDYLTAKVTAAITRGRDACLAARDCPACGGNDPGPPTFFCRACGRSHVPAVDGYFFANFTCTVIDGRGGRPVTICLGQPEGPQVALRLDGPIDGDAFVPFADIHGRLYDEWPGSTADTATRLALEAVLGATDGAYRLGRQYARLSGRCFVCGAGLTDGSARNLGACAPCAADYGFPWA